MSAIIEEHSTHLLPTRNPILMSELHSPAMASSCSEADTVTTSRTHYTINTSGREYLSSRNDSNHFWHTPSFLSDRSGRATTQGSNGAARNSTDRALSPKSAAPYALPSTELLANPVATAGAPCSFFDSDSESDGEPVVRRASSVRTQRPQLVEHSSNASGRRIRLSDVSPIPSTAHGSPVSEVQLVLNSPLRIGHDLSSQVPPSNPADTRPGPSISKAEQLLGISLKDLVDLTPAVEKGNPVEGRDLGGPAKESINALASTPLSQSNLLSAPPSVIEVPNTRSRIEALSAFPSPKPGLTTLPLPRRHIQPTRVVNRPRNDSFDWPEIPVIDGLRSNAIRDSDISRLHQATSAPPLPFRHPHRNVPIQPHDPEATGEHILRQSVVSTPYPNRAGGLAVGTVSPHSSVASTKVSGALPKTCKGCDRFPSPVQPEVLYVHFAVARHPRMTTLIEVMVERKSAYDDEALFNVLRRSYRRTLLGFAQYLVSARALQSVTFADPGFNTASFLQHLHTPRVGRRRKAWLTWLREHQVQSGNINNSKSENGVSFSSPMSMPRMPFSKRHRTHPRLTFHFEFSLVRIALAIVGTIMVSALATILWVLFGVPGAGPAHVHINLVTPVEKWHADAQGRVLTGLVFGLLVAVLGALAGACWTVASWASL